MIGTGWATEAGGQYYNIPRYGRAEGDFEHGAYALGESVAGFLADPEKPLTVAAMNEAIRGATLAVWDMDITSQGDPVVLRIEHSALDIAADGDKLKRCAPCDKDAVIEFSFATQTWTGKNRDYKPLSP